MRTKRFKSVSHSKLKLLSVALRRWPCACLISGTVRGPECNLHCPVREFRDVVRRVGSRARSLGSNAVGCAISHTFPIIPLSSVLILQVWAMIILTPWECCEDWMDKYMKSAHTNTRGEYMHWGLVPAVNSLPLANSNVLTGSSSLCQAQSLFCWALFSF